MKGYTVEWNSLPPVSPGTPPPRPRSRVERMDGGPSVVAAHAVDHPRPSVRARAPGPSSPVTSSRPMTSAGAPVHGDRECSSVLAGARHHLVAVAGQQRHRHRARPGPRPRSRGPGRHRRRRPLALEPSQRRRGGEAGRAETVTACRVLPPRAVARSSRPAPGPARTKPPWWAIPRS